jgi:hypothetical protein
MIELVFMYYTVKKPILEVINLERNIFHQWFWKKIGFKAVNDVSFKL